jgi:hypothetical protein
MTNRNKKHVLIFLFLLLMVISYKQKSSIAKQLISDQEEEFTAIQMVNSKSGLVLRDIPSVNGKKILTIPYRGVVRTIKRHKKAVEIQGVTGRWTKVFYNYKEKENIDTGTSGWVFGAFLGKPEIHNCLSADELSSLPVFYMNVPASTFLTSTYLHDQFEFHSDKSGIISKVAEGRGESIIKKYPFHWQIVGDRIELTTDPITLPIVCHECDSLWYGPDVSKFDQCINKCKEKAIEVYGKSVAKYEVTISIRPDTDKEPHIEYMEKETEQIPGKSPWKVAHQYSSITRVIDIFKEAGTNTDIHYSCLMAEKLGGY